MKKIISTTILVIMLLLSMIVFSSAEDVVATGSNFANVPFLNGYYGFCIDKSLDDAENGDRFSSISDTTAAKNNITGEDISQKLKIMFTQCFDSIFVSDGNGSYVVDSLKAGSSVQSAVWHFSDGYYIWGEAKTFVDTVNAYAGPEIPDDGYWITLDNGDIAIFHFKVFEP